MAKDGLANRRDVAAGGEVHDSVCAEVDGGVQLAELFVDVRGEGGVADVGVDLAERGDADGHGLELGVVDVRGDDHACPWRSRSERVRREIFSLCATKAISSVILPRRAKCIWLMFQSPVRSGFFLALDDPLLARFRDDMAVAVVLFRGS